MANIKGMLKWQGDSGSPRSNETFSILPVLSETTPWGKIIAFSVSMNPKSECSLLRRYYMTSEPLDTTPPGLAISVNNKARVFYRDPSSLEVLHFEFPAPIAADLEVTPWGKRLKQSAVVTIVGYISTLAGISYVPLYGTYYMVV